MKHKALYPKGIISKTSNINPVINAYVKLMLSGCAKVQYIKNNNSIGGLHESIMLGNGSIFKIIANNNTRTQVIWILFITTIAASPLD